MNFKALIFDIGGTVFDWSTPVVAALARHDCFARTDAEGFSRGSGIDWDGILTCDVVGVYKPDPRCYARAAEVVGYRPDRIAMVAAHPGDLRAAMRAGYGAVYVRPRLEDPGDDYTDTGFFAEFDVVADDFEDLARRLVPAGSGR